MADVVVPGQRLGYLDDYSPGPGTYVRGDLILASVVGFRRVAEATVAETGKKRSANGEPPEGGAAADSEKDEGGSVEDAEPVPPVLFVTREKEKTGVPDVDSIVTGRVVRVHSKAAMVAIMVVGSSPCREDFQGIIRTQDVRAVEKDDVQIYKCFRPGDVVRAQVISLGDARSYQLSTAHNDLGVIFAKSVAGAMMVPISWREMMCTKTKAIEFRKCAKPATSADPTPQEKDA